jgi:hypothetical protein
MKQAKFALTAVTILAVTGGALAFKANRINKPFYKYTVSVLNGVLTGICDWTQTVSLQSITVPVGGVLTTVSAAPNTSITTCTARIVPGL